MVHTLEHCFARLSLAARPPAAAAPAAGGDLVSSSDAAGTRWTWLVDFRGFGLAHAMQARTAAATLSAFSAHMPERLEAVVLLSPPGLFDALLAVLRPMLDARTAAKVHVVRPAGTGAALRADLQARLAPHGVAHAPVLDWLAAVLEMEPVPGNLPDTAPLGDLAQALRLDHARVAHEEVET